MFWVSSFTKVTKIEIYDIIDNTIIETSGKASSSSEGSDNGGSGVPTTFSGLGLSILRELSMCFNTDSFRSQSTISEKPSSSRSSLPTLIGAHISRTCASVRRTKPNPRPMPITTRQNQLPRTTARHGMLQWGGGYLKPQIISEAFKIKLLSPMWVIVQTVNLSV